MNTQLPPCSRASDPTPSFLADKHITLSGKRESQIQQAVRAVNKYKGLTCRELAKATGLDHEMLHKRLSDAEDLKLIYSSVGKHKCTVTGRFAQIWMPRGEKK